MTETSNKDQYRDTVFLPKTDFPMRGGLPKKEPEILADWDSKDLYKTMREQRADKPKWVLHDGPPYANGNIHMGHAVNKILKDVVVKFHAMTGHDTPYVPGWDCHGLPIEWKIEEKYRNEGKDKDEVDILEFREECRQFAKQWVDTQSAQFKRLGVSGDWDNPYLTMTNRAESQIVSEIHKFASNGLLYKGAKPVMWSVVEKTALAEAEVEYKEHKSVTVWVRFPVVKAADPMLEGADVVIWTTTPWTLPSNRAIGFGEGIEYGIYEFTPHPTSPDGSATLSPGERESERSEQGEGTRKIAVATNLAEEVFEFAKIENYKLVGTLSGDKVAGTVCAHPLRGQGYDFDVPLLAADFVTDDAGTGFVHIAPGHGEDDFHLGVANSIEVTDNVSDDGLFRDHVPLFAGMEVYTQKGELGGGNFAVLKALKEAGKLFAKGSLRHEYPHSWRSKAPLIFRTTPQWFIAMDKVDGRNVKEAAWSTVKEGVPERKPSLRETALKEIKKTKWVPEKGENRITAMIENRPDWCISRQRAWGVPIALFVHKDTDEILADETVLKRIADIFEAEGSDAWWKRDAQEFLGDAYNADDYTQVFDIVDVWFESGSTHAFVCEDRDDLHSPADLYLEGSDQHRGWFQSSLLESCGSRGQAPYKAVLTHGFVLDEKGYKMSKSLGNVVDPIKLMDQSGADILRLWTMTSNFAEDMKIGSDMLKTTSDLYRRIRNTLRFLLGALDGFTKADMVIDFDDPSDLPELEQLVLHQLYEMDQKIRTHITNYDFGKIAKLLHDFCNETLSAFYFDIRKDSLYCDDPNDPTRKACRAVMAVLFNGLTAWLAPILVFTAEEAWSHCPQGVFEDKDSVHCREFPNVPEAWRNPALAGKWFAVREVRDAIIAALEPYRKDKTIGSSLEAAPDVAMNADYQKAVKGLNLADIAIVSSVTIEDGEGLGVSFTKADGDKCVRCWKVLPEVNDDLCNRCTDAVQSVQKAA